MDANMQLHEIHEMHLIEFLERLKVLYFDTGFFVSNNEIWKAGSSCDIEFHLSDLERSVEKLVQSGELCRTPKIQAIIDRGQDTYDNGI
jgi:hypothetical protein